MTVISPPRASFEWGLSKNAQGKGQLRNGWLWFSTRDRDKYGSSIQMALRKGNPVYIDIVLFLVFMVFGGLLGLAVEAQKHLYPIYIALVLLVAAEVLDRLGKAIGPRNRV